MKVKFDYGIGNDIDLITIAQCLRIIIDECKETSDEDISLSNGVVYLNFYANGFQQDVLDSTGDKVGYIIRRKPYKRIPDGTRNIIEIDNKRTKPVYLYKIADDES